MHHNQPSTSRSAFATNPSRRDSGARSVGALGAAASAAACVLAVASCGEPAPGGSRAAGGGGFVESARAAGLDFHMNFLPAEQGEKFRINLYDHGSGVAVCDYDGDGDDDLYLLNQLGRNALFRNDGTGRFADVTDEAGVGLGDRICVAGTFADYDGDGWEDLFVTSTRGGNVLFRNDGNGRFIDVTAAAGLSLVAHSQSGTFFDHDDDGDLDLFVTNTARWTSDRRDPQDGHFEGPATLDELQGSVPEPNVLYRNDGNGRFTDVTAAAGVAGHGWGGDTAVLDYDGDGRPDLFVTNMFGSLTTPAFRGGCTLYRNRGDGTFEDVSAAALGRTSAGAVGAKALDFDGDGLLDLFVVDMHSDMWMGPATPSSSIEPARKYDGPLGPASGGAPAPAAPVVFGNTLYRNLGNGRFEEVSDRARAETFWPWGIAAADFDQDGREDAFIPSGMGFPFFYWPSGLLMNQGDGTFADRAAVLGVEPPAGGQYLKGLIGNHAASRSARSAAVGDFDGDGRPDLVVNMFNDVPLLYMNRFPQRTWVGIRLTGARANRSAVGALVRVKAGGRTFVRQVESASGYLAQRTRTLNFGLGGAAEIDACEVVWPGGARQRFPASSIRMNSVNDLAEPGATARRDLQR